MTIFASIDPPYQTTSAHISSQVENLTFFKNHFALLDMILEVAVLNIKDGLNAEFEAVL
jgi:hypothetical protein